jgi:hypothetical protein
MTTSPSQSTTPGLLHLPDGLSPDSIDTLPILSAILSRLQNPAATTSSTSPPSTSPSQLASGGSLAVKDIPAATDELKHKLQKARAQVKGLPDIDRTLAEQEEEIRELEGKIGKQRGVLEELKEVGLKAKREREEGEKGEVMEGVES